MSYGLVIGITFGVILVLIFLRLPIYSSLGVGGAVGIFLSRGMIGITQLPMSLTGQLVNFVMVAVPLFILMGEVLSKTGIGKDIYEVMYKWTSGIPGGLAIASIVAAAVFGAMSGVSIAAVAVIGVMAIPEMLRHGYDRSLAAGAVAAPGALAMLIPPSLLFVLYGAVSGVSVSKLLIGGIVPGLFLAAMMILYVFIRVKRNPSLAPRIEEKFTWKERFMVLRRLWSAVIVILFVIGSMYSGLATATEAAAFGALGAFLVAGFAYKALNWKTLKEILSATSRTTGAVLMIAANAFIFSQFLVLTRVPELLSQSLTQLNWAPSMVMLLVIIVFIVLGMFMDGASFVLVTTPIILPTVIALGYSPLWYGIILVMKTEMAVIMPPIGLNLYTLKSAVPQLNMDEIIRGCLPYVVIEFAALLLFLFVPGLALWLPGLMK